MLGSGFEADDAVQETMVRAWKGMESFEGRSGLRSWLYRIATNVCLDMLRSRQRRARPMDLGPSSTTEAFTGERLSEHAWVEPISDSRVLPTEGDPAELAAARDSIRLAFVAALQHLPARQRAVLIL
ncbi:MAG: sigma-70 family RNA polymerase sigma factor, partial [Actinomycetota bacterium]|nr:sigma-70 family RNA polymerase sigma factor [Actinomycetota bacterium]